MGKALCPTVVTVFIAVASLTHDLPHRGISIDGQRFQSILADCSRRRTLFEVIVTSMFY